MNATLALIRNAPLARKEPTVGKDGRGSLQLRIAAGLSEAPGATVERFDAYERNVSRLDIEQSSTKESYVELVSISRRVSALVLNQECYDRAGLAGGSDRLSSLTGGATQVCDSAVRIDVQLLREHTWRSQGQDHCRATAAIRALWTSGERYRTQ